MIEDEIEAMMKKTKEYQSNLEHHDKNLDRIMEKYRIGAKPKSRITADKFLKASKRGKVQLSNYKDSYALIEDVRKQLRKKTLLKLRREEEESNQRKNTQARENLSKNPSSIALSEDDDNRSMMSNGSSRSKNRFKMLKKRLKRHPSPKLDSLKQRYHEKSLDKPVPPKSTGILINALKRDEESSNLISGTFKNSQSTSKAEHWEQEIELNEAIDKDEQPAGEKSNSDMISFLSNNPGQRRTTLTQRGKQEESSLFELSLETSKIGMIKGENRLSTIRLNQQNSKRNPELNRKLQQLYEMKKNLEQEIIQILS